MGAFPPRSILEALQVASPRQRCQPGSPSAALRGPALLPLCSTPLTHSLSHVKKKYPTEFPPHKHFPEARGFAKFLEGGHSAPAAHTGASQQKRSSESKEREENQYLESLAESPYPARCPKLSAPRGRRRCQAPLRMRPSTGTTRHPLLRVHQEMLCFVLPTRVLSLALLLQPRYFL